MLETIGWLSTVMFALSGGPLALHALRVKRTDVPWSTIILVLVGSLGMLIYEFGTGRSLPQLWDFGINSACWATLAYIKKKQ